MYIIFAYNKNLIFSQFLILNIFYRHFTHIAAWFFNLRSFGIITFQRTLSLKAVKLIFHRFWGTICLYLKAVKLFFHLFWGTPQFFCVRSPFIWGTGSLSLKVVKLIFHLFWGAAQFFCNRGPFIAKPFVKETQASYFLRGQRPAFDN